MSTRREELLAELAALDAKEASDASTKAEVHSATAYSVVIVGGELAMACVEGIVLKDGSQASWLQVGVPESGAHEVEVLKQPQAHRSLRGTLYATPEVALKAYAKGLEERIVRVDSALSSMLGEKSALQRRLHFAGCLQADLLPVRRLPTNLYPDYFSM